MASSSEDEIPLAQRNSDKRKAKQEAVAESCVGESPDPKAENGDQQKKDEPEDVEEKPPPEKKRKKSSDSVPKAKQAAAKKQEKAEPKKTDTKDAAKVTKPKVKYDMPGQTQPTPSTGEPLAKFYMSLLKQKPDSEIAPKWLVQRGLLPQEEAEAWLKKNGKSTTSKSPSKPRVAAGQKAGARKSKDKPAQAAKKPAKKPARAPRKGNKDVLESDPDEYESASEGGDDSASEDEVMPQKSKRVSAKSTGRASVPARNGKGKGAKKKQEDSGSEDADSDDYDEKPSPGKGKSAAAQQPVDDQEMSDDSDIPLASRPTKQRVTA